MSESNPLFAIELYKVLKKRGLRASDLTPAQLAAIAVKAAGPKKAVQAGLQVAVSAVRTKVLNIRVPLEVNESRRAGCKSNVCGFYEAGPRESIICKKCGCSAKMMDIAIEDPRQSCRLPKGKKVWEAYVPANQP